MKFLLPLLLTFSVLFSVPVDKTWFENSNEELHKIYETQLNTILNNKDTEQKEQLDYQKTLLQKLNSTLDSKSIITYPKIENIQNTKEFLDIVKMYLTNKNKSKDLQKEINKNEDNLNLIEEQLNKIEDKHNISTINSQLLYALYTLENKKKKELLNQVQNNLYIIRQKLLNSIDNININESSQLEENKNKLLKDLNFQNKEEQKYLLVLDKEKIKNNTKSIENLTNKLNNINEIKQNIIKELIFNKFENSLSLLQQKNNAYFDIIKEIQVLNKEYNANYDDLIELFKYFSREKIGLTKSTLADTKDSLLDVLKFSINEINKPYIPLGNGVSILDIIKFLMIFIIGFSAASIYRKKISKANLKNSSPATKTMLANLGFYFLVFITFVFALNSVGIDLSSLTILVGALSVGIGFGLQNIVSNFISGIILIFEKSIQVGNIIEIENEIRGRVTQINMRSSVITTFDNIDVIIPNSTLMQNNVTNLTFADDARRLHIPFGVAYGTNAKYVINLILEELANSDLVYIQDDKDKIPRVWMTAMGASSVDFKLLVWINANTNKKGQDSSNISDFLVFIYEVLYKHNIEIPFPQMDIHLKKEENS